MVRDAEKHPKHRSSEVMNYSVPYINICSSFSKTPIDTPTSSLEKERGLLLKLQGQLAVTLGVLSQLCRSRKKMLVRLLLFGPDVLH